jgi:hypothetical protein
VSQYVLETTANATLRVGSLQNLGGANSFQKMNVRVNVSMLKLLGGDPEYYEPSSLLLPTALQELATGGFKEIDGCVVPMSFAGSSIWSLSRPRIANVDDETSTECSLSKVRVDDFLTSKVGLDELARMGLDFAWILHRELLASHLPGFLRIIVSAQLPDASLDVGPNLLRAVP